VNTMESFVGFVAVGLIAYLFVSIVRPDKF
jgi:K+-transporting ATPase KdpF subunit